MLLLRRESLSKLTNNNGKIFFKKSDSEKVIEFDEKECFILQALVRPYSEIVLVSQFNSKFNATLTLQQLRDFLARLEEMGLVEEQTDGLALETDLISSIGQNGCRSKKIPADESDDLSEFSNSNDDVKTETANSTLVHGSTRMKGSDKAKGSNKNYRNHLRLFAPQKLIDALLSLLGFLRFFSKLVPIICVFSIVGFFLNLDKFEADLHLIKTNTGFLAHIFFTLFTTNLTTQLFKGLVARHFKFKTPSFGIMLVFGLLPRFNLRIETPESTPRKAKLWVAVAPIYVRFILFPIGVVLWLTFRGQGTTLALFGLALALVTMISFLFVSNPLLGGAGYRFISEYYNSPNLRKKAFRAVRYMFFKPPDIIARYAEDSAGLRVYAFSSIIFLMLVVGFIGMTLAKWLEFNYGGLGVFVFLVIASYLFIRFGLPTLPKKIANVSSFLTKGKVSILRIFIYILLISIMFLPWQYESGGTAEVFPISTQELYVQYPGVVRQVYFNGGEWLSKDVVIAEMDNLKQSRDVEATEAKIRKAEEDLKLLLTTPSAEEIEVARQQLLTSKVKLNRSKDEYLRIEKLFNKDLVALKDFLDSKKIMELDQQEVIERKANLLAIKNQVNLHAIESSKIELEILKRELIYLKDVLQRTQLKMPIDGRIVSMNLQEYKNRYFDEGDLFVVVEDTSQIRVEVMIPESDIGEVEIGSQASLKLKFSPNKLIKGTVQQIHPKTTDTEFGSVVKVVCFFDNKDNFFTSGMTGYVKIQGSQMFVVEAFSRALLRFILVEAWSWLP